MTALWPIVATGKNSLAASFLPAQKNALRLFAAARNEQITTQSEREGSLTATETRDDP